MSLFKCPIQDICQHFSTGDSKPKNHDVRDKFPCTKFLDMTCILSVEIQVWAMGLIIACEIKK